MAETDDSSSTDPTMLRILAGPIAESVWKNFYERYTPLVYDACRKSGLQLADADEIHSRVFTKLVKTLPKFQYDPAFRFRGWLRTIVMHEIGDYMAELKRRPGSSGVGGETDLVATIPEPLKQLATELDTNLGNDLDRAERVMARVRQRVDESTWQSYWMAEIEGLSAEAVAQQWKISKGSVYMNRSRVRKLLKEEGEFEAGKSSV